MKVLIRKIAVLSTLLATTLLASATIYNWAGPNGGNDNWSDLSNWLPTGQPGPNDTAVFGTTGQSGSPGIGSPDNVVNTDFTINALYYAATNISPNFEYHNTVIDSGVTLAIVNSNAAIVLDSGTQTDPAVTPPGLTASYSTISGAGALDVTDTNSASVVIVSQGSSTYSGGAGLWATLDMSGLNTFDGTFGRLLVGVQGVSPAPAGSPALVASGRQSGQLTLAATNVIRLTQVGNIQGTGPAAGGGPALVVNDVPFFGDYGSDLYLGQSNALFADSITIGRIQCSRTAVFEFNPNLSAPEQFYLRGYSSNRVAEFIVGDDTANGATANAPPGSGIVVPPGGFQVGAAGLVDVSAGTSDIMIDSLIVGKGFAGGGGGYAAGIFNMGAGTLNVNTLQLGVMSSAGETAPATGTFNISGGGSVVVNSGPVALGVTFGSPITAYATGILTINSGSLTVGDGAMGINDGGLSESEVNLTNATVTAANIGTPTVPVGSAILADSTLNLSLTSLEGAIVADSVTTASVSTGNRINITSISGFVGLQSAITIIQSDSPIAYAGSFNSGANGSDFVLGTLPTGYTGHLQVNGSTVQLILTQSPVTPNAWTGADISSHNTNWSDGHNWSSGAEPGPTDSAFFETTASVSSSALSHSGAGPSGIVSSKINNIVDGNVTIEDLDYANTNGTFQNTSISNNDTLTVGAGGLIVGNPVVDEGNTTANATISGAGGTLSINNDSAVIYVGLGHSNSTSTAEATLDMSGLGNFDANVGSFLVGVGSVDFATVLQPVGTVYLAQTNTITVTSGNGSADSALVSLDVGDAGDAETAAGFGDSGTSTLYLGASNAIFADYIDVGRQWASGGIYFNPAVVASSPTVYVRGASANAVDSWNIGDGAGNLLTGGGSTGTNDFTGGTVNALVNTLNIATSSSNSTTATAVTGTLTFNAGTIDANTVNISDNPGSGAYYSYGVGTLNVNGTATLIVNGALNLGLTPAAQAGGTPTATLNINGGSVWADNILAGSNGTISTINVTGGLLSGTNGIGLASAPVTTLNLTNATLGEGAGNAPFINAAHVNAGGSSNVILVLAAPPVEVYPATFTVLKSATPIAGAFNFQAVMPQGYSGIQLTESGDHTEIFVTVQSGPVTARGIVYWVGPDGSDINWSDANNWFLPPIPAAPDTAYFDNAGESSSSGAGSPDNIVDTNATIAALWYAQTNAAADGLYHNTVINSGKTLTISNANPVIVVDAGTQTDPGTGTTANYSTISGSGTLDVFDTNTESVMIVSQGSSSYYYPSAGLWSSLDMSGLNSFNGTFGRLLLGIQGVGVTPGEVTLVGSGRQTGRLTLALTNVIHLTQTGNIQGGASAAAGGPALVVMDTGFFGDNGSILTLGQSNAIWADTITVGRNGALQSGVMQLNPNITGPQQVFLRGESSNRVSEFIVADGTENPNSSQYEAPDPRIAVTPAISGGLNVDESGIVDVGAGTSDMMIDTLIVGKGYDAFGGGYTVGQFNMGAGTLNVNALELGVVSSSSANGAPVTGILNVMAGTVIVNDTLYLGLPADAGTVSLADGDLDITNGTVEASSIEASGSANSAISITSGTLALTSPGGSIGTVAAPVGSITLSGGTTLDLAVGGSGPAVAAGSFIGSGSGDIINITSLPLITKVPSTNTLIKSASAISSYGFTLGTIPAGYTGTLSESADSTSVLLVINTAPPPPTKGVTITSAKLVAGNFVLSGTNGVANGEYILLTSTNLAAPAASRWTPIETNVFDGNGDFNISLPAAEQDQYFKIETE